MSDIVERLRFRAEENYEMLGNIHEPLLEAADEITRLRAENERLTAERDRQYDQNAEQVIRIAGLDAENEKLRAALHEAADELDACYRAEYCGDHPYAKRKLAEAKRQNPARIAITQEVK